VSRKALAPCSVSGCPTLTRTNRCEKHEREADLKRGTSVERGYDHRWRKVRAAFIRANPVCQDPEGCIADATDVDHIDGEGPRGDNSPENLRSLCHHHHSRRTAEDQPGGWNLRDDFP
jgi:5-methylcytosine-specific restriction enzyme A